MKSLLDSCCWIHKIFTVNPNSSFHDDIEEDEFASGSKHVRTGRAKPGLPPCEQRTCVESIYSDNSNEGTATNPITYIIPQQVKTYRTRKKEAVQKTTMYTSTFTSIRPVQSLSSLTNWKSSNAYGEHMFHQPSNVPGVFADMNRMFNRLGVNYDKNGGLSSSHDDLGKRDGEDANTVKSGDAHLVRLVTACKRYLNRVESAFADRSWLMGTSRMKSGASASKDSGDLETHLANSGTSSNSINSFGYRGGAFTPPRTGNPSPRSIPITPLRSGIGTSANTGIPSSESATNALSGANSSSSLTSQDRPGGSKRAIEVRADGTPAKDSYSERGSGSNGKGSRSPEMFREVSGHSSMSQSQSNSRGPSPHMDYKLNKSSDSGGDYIAASLDEHDDTRTHTPTPTTTNSAREQLTFSPMPPSMNDQGELFAGNAALSKYAKRVEIVVAYSEILQLKGTPEEAEEVVMKVIKDLMNMVQSQLYTITKVGDDLENFDPLSTEIPITPEPEPQLQPQVPQLAAPSSSSQAAITVTSYPAASGTSLATEASGNDASVEPLSGEHINSSSSSGSSAVVAAADKLINMEMLLGLESDTKDWALLVAACLRRLGSLFKLRGKLERADEAMRDYIELVTEYMEKEDSSSIRDVANAYSLLATVQNELGRRSEAVLCDKKALELMILLSS